MSDIIGGWTDSTKLVSSVETYDPANGFSTRQTYKGTEDGLRTLASAFQANGVPSELAFDNGRWQLIATVGGVVGGGTGSEQSDPIDKWTISRDYVTETLWASAKLMLLASDALVDATDEFAGRFTTIEEVLADARRACENAIKGFKKTSSGVYGTTADTYTAYSNGPLLPAETGFIAGKFKDAIYRQYVLGMEGYEVERLTLARVRTYPWAYLDRIQLEVVPIVYTTAQMTSVWAVPSAITAKLPSNPPQQPPNTMWGWKMRRNNWDVRFDGRTEEVTDWVFAAWSTLTHTFTGDSNYP